MWLYVVLYIMSFDYNRLRSTITTEIRLALRNGGQDLQCSCNTFEERSNRRRKKKNKQMKGNYNTNLKGKTQVSFYNHGTNTVTTILSTTFLSYNFQCSTFQQ